MLQPLLNQLARMSEMNSEAAPPSKGGKRRGLAGAVGLGAALSLAAAQQADAATELAQVAASDSRCVGLWWAEAWGGGGLGVMLHREVGGIAGRAAIGAAGEWGC